MVTVKSQKGQRLLAHPKFFTPHVLSTMRRYPSDAVVIWVELKGGPENVKNLSFSGQMDDWQRVILESMASLMMNQSIQRFEGLTLRECEAFLRDRNSEVSIEGISSEAEGFFKKFFTWLRLWPFTGPSEEYAFPLGKGPFEQLSLADKVRELKKFLNSQEVIKLYEGVRRPELVDVEGLTAFIEAPYESENERALFEELHMLATGAFQEEKLNFIPEA